jgi:hypothetical protein
MLNDDLVNVLVPRSMVTGVYRYIASQTLVAPEEPTSLTESAEPGSERAHILAEWTPDITTRMVRESPRAMKDILGVLAENAGKELSTGDLAKSIKHKPDADSNTVAGTLGAFGRRVANRYDKNVLPFEGRWDHEKHYKMHKMPAEIAQVVLQALRNGA